MPHHKHSRREVAELLPLLLSQVWLGDCIDAYRELIRLCSTESQKALIHSLIGRFTYLDERQLDLILQAIVTQVFDTWNFPLGQTQFVATTWDEESDGAQAILDALRGRFAIAGITNRDVKAISTVQKAAKHLHACPNVVLIDDFFGSGQTLGNRVE